MEMKMKIKRIKERKGKDGRKVGRGKRKMIQTLDK